MTQIEKVLTIDLTKVDDVEDKKSIQSFIKEYNRVEDKKDFIEATWESVELTLKYIEQEFPEAIKKEENPCDDTLLSSKQTIHKNSSETASKTQGNKKDIVRTKSRTKNTPSKGSLKQALKVLQAEVEECRKNGITRKSTQKKKATTVKTVYDKVYSHINAIANLLPERFKDDPQKVGDLKRMSLSIHKKVVMVFEMNQEFAEKGKAELKEKFKKMNQKFKEKENDN